MMPIVGARTMLPELGEITAGDRPQLQVADVPLCWITGEAEIVTHDAFDAEHQLAGSLVFYSLSKR